MRRWTTVVVAGAIGAASVALARQAPQTPVFRASATVVQLDVSVLDKDGQPVRGLKADDFTVLEDGKPQKVVAFDPIDVADVVTSTAASEAAWTREVSPDVVTNQLDNKRLVLLVLDDATLVQGFDPTGSLCGTGCQGRPGGGTPWGREDRRARTRTQRRHRVPGTRASAARTWARRSGRGKLRTWRSTSSDRMTSPRSPLPG
jgi:hypothetical protein